MMERDDSNSPPAVTLAELQRIEIFVGDSMVAILWKLLTLTQLQFRNLMDLVTPGAVVWVNVSVQVPEPNKDANR